MGHATGAAISHLVKGTSYDMNANIDPEELSCKDCIQAKTTKPPSNGNLVGSSQQMTVHTDLYGPFRQQTYTGRRLFVTFTVTPSHDKDFKRIRSQDQVPMHCCNFIKWVEQNTGLEVKRVDSDNARVIPGNEKGFTRNGHHT